jgi:C1A family cysteine protease
MKFTLLLLAVGTSAANLKSPQYYETRFAAWQAQFPEYPGTLQAFADNDDNIEQHQELYRMGNVTYELGHNQFSGLTNAEFKARYLNANFEAFDSVRPKNYDMSLAGRKASQDPIDWVAKGAVTPIKDQAQCGSCWAFSTVAGMEGALFVNEGKLLSFSEQDLVSCAASSGNQGCNGGLMDQAFDWIESNGGICLEADYPYTSSTGTTGLCKKGCTAAATLTGHKDVPKGDEDALYAALQTAPVSVAVDASKFQSYKSGILNPLLGCGTQLDHGVTVVGFGTGPLGTDYWKIKNSWGASWGESGYIRLLHGKDLCGVADSASQPTGVKSL